MRNARETFVYSPNISLNGNKNSWKISQTAKNTNNMAHAGMSISANSVTITAISNTVTIEKTVQYIKFVIRSTIPKL